MASLLDRFSDYLRRARLLAQPRTAIVAVSGGTDSVALLDVLQAVAAERGLALVVAHADHGIQEASGDVGKWVGGLAARYGLPFELGELNLGPNATETVARRARYAWLREVQRRRAARYLVTAHHQDDQVETVMLRVLRGSAPAGLAGIPARARGGLVRLARMARCGARRGAGRRGGGGWRGGPGGPAAWCGSRAARRGAASRSAENGSPRSRSRSCGYTAVSRARRSRSSRRASVAAPCSARSAWHGAPRRPRTGWSARRGRRGSRPASGSSAPHGPGTGSCRWAAWAAVPCGAC